MVSRIPAEAVLDTRRKSGLNSKKPSNIRIKASALDILTARMWLIFGKWLESKSLTALASSCYRNAADAGGRAGAEAAFRIGKQFIAEGKNTEAAGAYEQALRENPRHARAWCGLGVARRRLAQVDAAREAYEAALRLDPEFPEALCNLGELRMVADDASGALTCFERALAHAPHLLEALNNKVAALYELSRYDEAEALCRQAIERHPREASLHVNLGNVLLHTARARPAVKAFRKALECDSSCAEAHMNLATLFGETRHLASAIESIEESIALKGENVQRLVSLALAQRASNNLAASELTCRKVLDLQPGNVAALMTLAGCRSVRAEHHDAIELTRQALKTDPNIPALVSNIAFDATYLPDLSADEVFALHREWANRFEVPVIATRYSHAPGRDPDRPLRIGYVSGDFGHHPVGFLLRDVVRNHDRTRFLIHGYSMMRHDDDVTIAIRDVAEEWTDALLMSDQELAEQVHRDKIDILVDLSGHTAFNRLPAFALRPAPVQATWIGYFHSTGLQSIDYFITDPHTSPSGCRQAFSETPVHLPHSRFCYAPPAYAPEVAPLPSRESGSVTFGSFNRVDKLVDPVIGAWARILVRTPGSRLVLKAGNLEDKASREYLRRRFAALGIDGDRLDLRGASLHPDMLAQYGDIDIALDPFPFNGGMTTLEALWMGVPVVTLSGDAVVSRQTYSVLANLGLLDFAKHDVDAYIQCAIELAGNLESLAQLRRELRVKMQTSPLCQPKVFAQDLEDLYRRMWWAWCREEKLPSDV